MKHITAHTAKARLASAKAHTAQGRTAAQVLAETAPNSIDRIMLSLAATMCANAERQLVTAWQIIRDVAAEPLEPDRRPPGPEERQLALIKASGCYPFGLPESFWNTDPQEETQ